MTQPEAVFFDCDGTLVDSEVICSRAYVHMFQEFGITLELAEIFKRFTGVKLYEIIDTINAEPIEASKNKTLFENLTPLFPRKRFRLERGDGRSKRFLKQAPH